MSGSSNSGWDKIKPRNKTSTRVPPPGNKDGRFLAKCRKCGMWSAKLDKCFACNEVFRLSVEIVEDPFKLPLAKSSDETSIKSEEATVKRAGPSSAATDKASGLSRNESITKSARAVKRPNAKLKTLPETLGFEKRIRILENSPYSRSCILRILNSVKDKKGVIQTQTDPEDTVVEEIRAHDIPLSLRIIQISVSGVNKILEDPAYTSKLAKIVFGCPIPIDWIFQILHNTLGLEKVRFGIHSFHLSDLDKEKRTMKSNEVLAIKVESLDMPFDRSRYADYDERGKWLMRLKIATVLQMASTAFPNLMDCNVMVPDELEGDLDDFLDQNIQIKKRGCKQHNYKDKTVHFKVEPIPKMAPEPELAEDHVPICRNNEPSHDADDITVIHLSGDEDDD